MTPLRSASVLGAILLRHVAISCLLLALAQAHALALTLVLALLSADGLNFHHCLNHQC